MRGSLLRSRWAGIGAAVAVSMGAGGAGWIAHASSGSAPSSFVPIAPCRLFDTRPETLVGNRATPLNAGEVWDRQVWGTNGSCTIPASATGISFNLTVPTGIGGYVTVYPGDASRPNSSTLNPVLGEGVKANGGIVGLSTTGGIKLYTLTGPINALLDITGYFVSAAGIKPSQVVTVAKSGGDFTTITEALSSITDNSATKPYLIRVAPGVYTEANGIDLKDYVDVEGSGQSNTIITADSAATQSTTVRVAGTMHGEIRNVTINNTGGAGFTPAVGLSATNLTPAGGFRLTGVAVTVSGHFNTTGISDLGSAPVLASLNVTAAGNGQAIAIKNDASSPRMTDITASASSGGDVGGALGIYNVNNSSPTMTAVTAFAGSGFSSATGILNKSSSSPSMNNVTARGLTSFLGGLGIGNDLSSSPIIRNSNIVGGASGNSIYNSNGSAASVTNSILSGGAVGGSGFICHFNTDENGATLVDGTCAG